MIFKAKVIPAFFVISIFSIYGCSGNSEKQKVGSDGLAVETAENQMIPFKLKQIEEFMATQSNKNYQSKQTLDYPELIKNEGFSVCGSDTECQFIYDVGLSYQLGIKTEIEQFETLKSKIEDLSKIEVEHLNSMLNTAIGVQPYKGDTPNKLALSSCTKECKQYIKNGMVVVLSLAQQIHSNEFENTILESNIALGRIKTVKSDHETVYLTPTEPNDYSPQDPSYVYTVAVPKPHTYKEKIIQQLIKSTIKPPVEPETVELVPNAVGIVENRETIKKGGYSTYAQAIADAAHDQKLDNNDEVQFRPKIKIAEVRPEPKNTFQDYIFIN